jgi:endonuclease-3
MEEHEKVKEVLVRLYKLYPNPKTSLNFNNPFELLVATILSAQTLDATVNKITPELFNKFPDAKSFANATIDEIAQGIKKVNFFNNKAKFIKAMSEKLVNTYGGEVPDSMDELLALPGVARKTANVVLGQGFGRSSGIAVDTHVMRIVTLLGLTDKKDPVKIEQDLLKIVPKENWIDFTPLVINYGREYCPAKKHDHEECPLGDLYTK